MQGPTHRAGGVSAALIGYIMSSSQSSPLIVAAPLASFAVIYPYALWGSTAPDLDHHPGSLWDEMKLFGGRSGHTIPSQDPISRGISQLLHITRKPRSFFKKRSVPHTLMGVLDCKHRSWQTHSEIPALLLIFFLFFVPQGTDLSSSIFQLVATGLLCGVLAHLTLDLITPEGLPFATGLFINRVLLRKKILPERIKVVPHIKPTKKDQPGFFSTGGTWEKKIIFNILHTFNIVVIAYLIWTRFLVQYVDLAFK